MEEENLEKIEKELKEVEKEESQNKEANKITALWRDYDGDDRVVRFKELKQEIDEREKPQAGIKTNISKLDYLTEGFRGGNLITVSGLSGMGKTTLLQSFLIEFARQEIGSIFFTYEVQPEDFLEKFGENIPSFSYIPRQHKKSKMQWLEERIVESIAKYNTKVVMIDHLHYLLPMEDIGKFGNTSLLIGSIMRNLKEIALKYNLVLFLVAHTKKIKMIGNESLDMDSIRDSSFCVQESDFVFFVDRGREIKENDNIAIMSIVKNRRNGKLGKIDLTFSENQLRETEKYHEEELGEKEIKKLI